MVRICIDPGHGGKYRSNVGQTGYIEADGVLTISKYLKNELISTGSFDVLLTRETDATLELAPRAQIAIDFGADMFISEHTNAWNGSARGTATFYSVKRPNDEYLATKLTANISSALGIPARSSRAVEHDTMPGEDYYVVIRVAANGGVPHALIVESAFHDNLEDEAILKVDANLKKIAKAQCKAICDYYGFAYPGYADSVVVTPPVVEPPAPTPTPTPIPEPTPIPTPEPTPIPVPEPIPTPTPEPTPIPKPIPIPTPAKPIPTTPAEPEISKTWSSKLVAKIFEYLIRLVRGGS